MRSETAPGDVETSDVAPPVPLRGRTLVFVEGADEERLIYHLLKARKPDIRVFGPSIVDILSKSELRALESNGLDVQLLNAAGRANLGKLQALAVARGFEDVERLVVVWDAEESAQSSFLEVQTALREAFPNDAGMVPNQVWVASTSTHCAVMVVILPDGIAAGALESLVLEAVRKTGDATDLWECVEAYIQCVAEAASQEGELNVAQAGKRMLNAWLAVRKPLGLRLGAAVDPRHGVVNMGSATFDRLFTAILGGTGDAP